MRRLAGAEDFLNPEKVVEGEHRFLSLGRCRLFESVSDSLSRLLVAGTRLAAPACQHRPAGHSSDAPVLRRTQPGHATDDSTADQQVPSQ